MEDSKKFLKKVSTEARSSNKNTFDKIKEMLSFRKETEEEKKKRERKELIEKEQERTFESLKNRPY